MDIIYEFLDFGRNTDDEEEVVICRTRSGEFLIQKVDLLYEVTKIVKGKIDSVIELRKYRHYKGGIYTSLAIGEFFNSNEKFMIYKDGDGNLWVRPLEEFRGYVCVRGELTQRFTHL